MTLCRMIVLLFVISAVGVAAATPTINNVDLWGDATAGEDADSFSQSTAGFYNATAEHTIGLAEGHFASSVVEARIEGRLITLHASTYADSAAPAGSLFSAEATAYGAIDFSLARAYEFDSEATGSNAGLLDLGTSEFIDLATTVTLPPGEYRLQAEAYSSTDANSLGPLEEASFVFIEFKVPEPSTLLVALIGLSPVLRGRPSSLDRGRSLPWIGV